jgi:hypothetical protein
VDLRAGLNIMAKTKISVLLGNPVPVVHTVGSQFTDFAILTHIQQHQHLFIYYLLISYLIMITDVARHLQFGMVEILKI